MFDTFRSLIPKPFEIKAIDVAEGDFSHLAQLAASISDSATTTSHVSQELAQTTQDPSFETLPKDFLSFAEACAFLSRQFTTFSKTTIKASDDWDDTFWRCIRGVLELWQRNTELNLSQIQYWQEQRQRIWPISFVFSSGKFTSLIKDVQIMDLTPRMDDARLMMAMFNLQLELNHESLDGRASERLNFLSLDLEGKATKIQHRISQARRQSNLPETHGRVHWRIAEVALSTSTRAKTVALKGGGMDPFRDI